MSDALAIKPGAPMLPESEFEFVGIDLATEPKGPYKTKGRRPQLHFSGLDTLWGCGEKFRRIYIMHERPDANISMMVGTAIDKAISANMESKMLYGKLLERADVDAIARDGFLAEWTLKTPVLTREEWLAGEAAVKGEAIDKTVRLSRLHYDVLAPKIEPTHVQRKWSIEIPGFPFDLVGAIDLQDVVGPIDDKTSKKSPVGNIADISLQMTTYALAILVLDGKIPEQVRLDYLIDNKTPIVKTYTSTRDLDDFRVLMNRVENAAEVIEKGCYTPANPTDWRCSTKWCGFAATCKYFQRPKSVVIDAGE